MTLISSGAAQRESAYAEIKRRIIHCETEFTPGAVLNESRIMELLALGRGPINQALHRLEVEGWVSILPRKGLLIASLSLDQLMEMASVRALNEVFCVGLAVNNARDDEIAAMRRIVERSPQLIAQRDIAGLVALDLAFHIAMSAASRNGTLAELLRALHEKQARFWFLSLSAPSHLEQVYREHLAIVEAFERRDAVAAQALMQHHIEEFKRNTTRRI
ncbi:DNA-binding GntR family transcriptional regulator [Chromobacterium alkanivorans]|uniref:GntR family transcriptional regulator n=1 Tax=Chromobacterium alkanivorans TaxID=1071719 RepID=UPI0019682569|nr:GntR family transcriptional regulator [Chromobacterium alkanivorans]MBN3002903.1 GntR family transcriptional regulator [Chromobacterium alkanivorans]MCS3803931.1 DNA-binding GntR family transcriptional regulator [Chromobacterium alkanivorans]MCS3817964.1 DNA-binding GntR family transcriptional regulator [Chromobacterium alkanivorans]MCS3875584.1 DNA-binding GntR family transcriptional regulator [Chromobacterium alkanivorans]